MQIRLEIFATGYKIAQRAAYAFVSRAYAEDGRTIDGVSAEIVEGYTKNQADVMAMIMALRGVRPGSRSLPTVFYAPLGYASQMIERGLDGQWLANPKANIAMIATARSLIKEFTNLTINKPNGSDPQFLECMKMARELCQNIK